MSLGLEFPEHEEAPDRGRSPERPAARRSASTRRLAFHRNARRDPRDQDSGVPDDSRDESIQVLL